LTLIHINLVHITSAPVSTH